MSGQRAGSRDTRRQKATSDRLHIAALTPYPDAVVVMTDGEAERPSVRHPQRWLWLLAEHGSDDAIRGIGRIVRVRADTLTSAATPA